MVCLVLPLVLCLWFYLFDFCFIVFDFCLFRFGELFFFFLKFPSNNNIITEGDDSLFYPNDTNSFFAPIEKYALQNLKTIVESMEGL